MLTFRQILSMLGLGPPRNEGAESVTRQVAEAAMEHQREQPRRVMEHARRLMQDNMARNIFAEQQGQPGYSEDADDGQHASASERSSIDEGLAAAARMEEIFRDVLHRTDSVTGNQNDLIEADFGSFELSVAQAIEAAEAVQAAEANNEREAWIREEVARLRNAYDGNPDDVIQQRMRTMAENQYDRLLAAAQLADPPTHPPANLDSFMTVQEMLDAARGAPRPPPNSIMQWITDMGWGLDEALRYIGEGMNPELPWTWPDQAGNRPGGPCCQAHNTTPSGMCVVHEESYWELCDGRWVNRRLHPERLPLVWRLDPDLREMVRSASYGSESAALGAAEEVQRQRDAEEAQQRRDAERAASLPEAQPPEPPRTVEPDPETGAYTIPGHRYVPGGRREGQTAIRATTEEVAGLLRLLDRLQITPQEAGLVLRHHQRHEGAIRDLLVQFNRLGITPRQVAARLAQEPDRPKLPAPAGRQHRRITIRSPDGTQGGGETERAADDRETLGAEPPSPSAG